MTPPKVPIVWVDAFCEGPYSGNPAAVCVLEHEPDPDAMQALATELGLSETAFVWPEDGAGAGTGAGAGAGAWAFGLRWFTPAAEVDLCGHATVATAHALAETGRLDGGRARFSTKSGWLEATVEGEEGEEGEVVEIDLPAEVPADATPPPEVSARWPVTRAATGRFDLLLELESEAAVRAVDVGDVDLSALPFRGVIVTARAAEAGGTASADGTECAAGAAETAGAAGAAGGFDYVLRFFAPRVGVPEDPVTGSAQCLLGPYWASLLGKDRLRAAQLSARGGVLVVRVGAERVAVAGRAVTILSGEVSGEAARRLLAPSVAAT